MIYLLFYNNRNIIIFTILIFISISGIFSKTVKNTVSENNFLSFFIYPIFWNITSQIKETKSYFKRIHDINTYGEKVKELETSLIEKQIINQDQDTLIEQNLKLKKQLLYKDFLDSSYPEKAISARVIYRMINKPSHIIILNRGNIDKIETGMPVIKFQFIKNASGKTLENIAVGRIGKVNNYFSELIPITDPRSKIYGSIKDSPYKGFISCLSYQDQQLILTYLEKTDPMPNKNELEVVTSAESIFPKELKIGKVIKIITTQNNMKQFIISPYFNLANLDYVFILKKNLNYFLKKLIGNLKTNSR